MVENRGNPHDVSSGSTRWSQTFDPAVRRDTAAQGSTVPTGVVAGTDHPDAPRGQSRDPRDPQDVGDIGEVGKAGQRFLCVEGRRWGYDPDDVDSYFARAEAEDSHSVAVLGSQEIRSAVFGRSRGGYEPAEVDAALDRLEDSAAQRENAEFIQDHGRQAWEGRIGELSDVIFGRLERGDGQRFRRPSGSTTRGYAMIDVDALCHAIVEELSQSDTVHPDRVRTAVFGPAIGDQAYEEQQVDAFLDKLVELLLALR